MKYVVLLLYDTGVTYFMARLIYKSESQKKKKCYLGITVVLCLAVLIVFKYLSFAVDSLNGLFHFMNVAIILPKRDFILPMGISFYTFQSMSYVIDIYRGKDVLERNPFRYALYVSFFPQLVAGPIERSENLLGQLRKEQRFVFDKFRDGLLLMLWGFFLKLVLADRIAVFVDEVYDHSHEYAVPYICLATILFAVQIYCDFYGYSIIAMGSAKILGIQLMDNFDSPYLASSVSEFWRRWHISLTSWFKDYLYIPLGGSRKGNVRKNLNKLIVFLTSGLWHGANWTYIIWGGLNGVFQILEDVIAPIRKKFHLQKEILGRLLRVISVIITFVLVDFTWIYFRAQSVKDANVIVKRIFSFQGSWKITMEELCATGLAQADFIVIVVSLLILLFADYCKYRKIYVREYLLKRNIVIRWTAYVIFFYTILILGWYGSNYGSSFIYFQF